MVLLFLETALNYIDLQTLSVLAPQISKEFHMTDSDYANITGAFLIAYSFAFLLGGWVIDKIGVRWGMILAIGWWSAAEILHGFAQNPTHLMICRFLFGLAYPGAYLAAAKLVSEWYPSKERGIATGVYTAGATVGATIAPPLISILSLSFGWRSSFVVVGVAGLVYLIIWFILYRSPEDHPIVTEAERNLILEGRVKSTAIENIPHSMSKTTAWDNLQLLLRNRGIWAVGLGRLLGDNPWIFYVLWLPMFLNKEFGLTLKDIGLIGWIPFLFADFGSLSGGWFSGRLIKRGWMPVRARLFVMACAAIVTMGTFILGQISSVALIIALLSLFMFCTMTWMVNIGTIPVDIFPPALSARAVGITTFMATMGQFGLNKAIGWCMDHEYYQLLFFLMAMTMPAAYILVRMMIPKKLRSSQPALSMKEASPIVSS
jgi:MFS transporter, ACS family, hexuronate transporter